MTPLSPARIGSSQSPNSARSAWNSAEPPVIAAPRAAPRPFLPPASPSLSSSALRSPRLAALREVLVDRALVDLAHGHAAPHRDQPQRAVLSVIQADDADALVALLLLRLRHRSFLLGG